MSSVMEHRIIDVYRGSQPESWLVVYQDGQIELHTENDGYACLRHGLEARDTMINMAEVAALERQHTKPLVQQVQSALAEMAAA